MKKIWLVAAILCNTAFLRPVSGQEVDFERIVITPSRSNEQLSRTPRTVSVITAEQIERSKPASIPELLSKEGFMVMRDFLGNGKTTNADIRGFGETGLSNVLVLIDGRRVNNIDLSGTDWTQLPVSMVKRIEILKGAASVLYGDNASAGVINIITKDPAEKRFTASTSGLAGSYSTYGAKQEISLQEGNISFLGLFDHYHTDGYRINSDLSRNDSNAKIKVKFTEAIDARFSFGLHEDTYGLPGALTDVQLNSRDRRASVKPDDFAGSRDTFFELGAAADGKDAGRLEAAFTKRKRNTFADFVTDFFLSERNTTTQNASLRYTLKRDILGYRNDLISGFDYQDAQQKVNEGMVGGAPDELALSKKNYGLFLQDQFYITDRLSLTPGYRFEDVRYQFEQTAVLEASEASRFTHRVFSAAANLSYDTDSNLYAGYSQSFRDPLVDEFFVSKYDFGFGPGGGLNTGLTPQKANNYEAGIRHYFNDRYLFALSIYRMDVRHEIYLEPSTFTNTNYDKTVHRGLEAETKLPLNDTLSLFAHYSLSDAYFRGGMYDKKKIPAVALHRANAGIELTLIKDLRLRITGNYVGERYFISDQVNVLPRMASYLTCDAKLTYSRERYSFFAGLNNIFNEEYYEYGAANYNRTLKNYYPAPEQNFVIGGSIKF